MMLEVIGILAVILLVLLKRKPRENEVPATPVAPDVFDLEYKVGNINLCLNEDKGGFNLFIQVGNFQPRFEETIEGKSLAEALAYSLKENGLKI